MKLALPVPSRPQGEFLPNPLGSPVQIPKWQFVNRQLPAQIPYEGVQLLDARQDAREGAWAQSLNEVVIARALEGQP